MPLLPKTTEAPPHRAHIAGSEVGCCMVDRQLPKREVQCTAGALAALTKEWEKLISQKCWDWKSVREYDDVITEAKKNCKKVHMGRLFDFVVDKNSEFAHLGQSKFKGRVVSKEITLKTRPV